MILFKRNHNFDKSFLRKHYHNKCLSDLPFFLNSYLYNKITSLVVNDLTLRLLELIAQNLI